jgi:hypothetical protein
MNDGARSAAGRTARCSRRISPFGKRSATEGGTSLLRARRAASHDPTARSAPSPRPSPPADAGGEGGSTTATSDPVIPSVASPEAMRSRGTTPTSTETATPKSRPSRPRPARAATPPAEDAHLEDPYGPGALKDPYR